MGLYVKPPKATDERETPQALFDALNAEFHFTLDVCATKDNAKCATYMDKKTDALPSALVIFRGNNGTAETVSQGPRTDRLPGAGVPGVFLEGNV